MLLQPTFARVPLLSPVPVQRSVLSVRLVASVKGGQRRLSAGVRARSSSIR
jgi:hypothetical protein